MKASVARAFSLAIAGLLALGVSAVLIGSHFRSENVTPVAHESSTGERAQAASSTTELVPEMELDGPTPLGPTVPTIDVYVSPTGSNGNSGRSAQEPVRSDYRVGQLIEPGSTVFMMPGRHPSFRVEDWTGTAAAPITLQPAPGAEGQVIVSDDDWDSDAAIWVVDSEHVVIRGLKMEESLWAVEMRGSNNIRITENQIYYIGQEAVHLRNGTHTVEIDNNSISDTGNRPGYTLGGSGIYVGSSDSVDPVHDVFIHHNDIFDTASEGIDVKPGTWNIVIEDNLIHDLATLQSGAVVLHLGNKDLPNLEPNIEVRRNRIWNISTASQWADGNGIVIAGAGIVENNVIYGNQHRAILVERFFAEGAPSLVEIRHNTFYGNGRTDVEIRGDRHDVRFDNNLSIEPILGPWSGSGNLEPSESDFVDPDAASFELVPTSQAVDAAVGSSGPDDDILNRPRNPGERDVGALEFFSGVPQESSDPSEAAAPGAAPDSEGDATAGGAGQVTTTTNPSTTTSKASSTTAAVSPAPTSSVPASLDDEQALGTTVPQASQTTTSTVSPAPEVFESILPSQESPETSSPVTVGTTDGATDKPIAGETAEPLMEREGSSPTASTTIVQRSDSGDTEASDVAPADDPGVAMVELQGSASPQPAGLSLFVVVALISGLSVILAVAVKALKI